MKRIEYDRYGGPELMHLAQFEPAAPGPDEILVRVKVAALNPVDWKIRNGDLGFMTGRKFPRAMGTEFSGVVERTGVAVTRLRPGDEVFGAVLMKDSGAFAEMLVTKTSLAVRKPPTLSFEQAACLSVAPVAAWRGLIEKAQIAAGQRLFVAGCCGAVGRAVVQLAKQRGASVTGSCGPADREAARQLGVDEVLDYTQGVPAALQARFDVVFDTAGKLSVSAGLALLAPRRGVLLDINVAPGRMLRGLLSRRYKIVMGMQSVPVLEALAAAAVEGTLHVQVGRTAPLAQAIELITDVEQGRKAKGRSVIVMSA